MLHTPSQKEGKGIVKNGQLAECATVLRQDFHL